MPDTYNPEEPTSATVFDDHVRSTELLGAELPDPRFVDTRYLEWLYDRNPLGAGIHGSADEGGRRMAHYAVIPQQYRCAGGDAPMVFSLNAVTRSGSQRRGWFTTIGRSLYARAAEWGAWGVIGVSNANSTPPVVRKLDFRLLGPLPVVVVPATGSAEPGVQHSRVDVPFLEGPAIDDLVCEVDQHPAQGWVHAWSAATLRWRLGAPNMASPYWVHVGQDLVVISTRQRAGGVPVAVILKLLPRGTGAHQRPAGAVVRAVCRFHRAPLALYAGFNRYVALGGLRPPRRWLPAPLNLIYRDLAPQAPRPTFTLDVFEFLDMDAY